MYTKNLGQCLAHSKCSVSCYYFNLDTLHDKTEDTFLRKEGFDALDTILFLIEM